jgi:hypothetical protein
MTQGCLRGGDRCSYTGKSIVALEGRRGVAHGEHLLPGGTGTGILRRA